MVASDGVSMRTKYDYDLGAAPASRLAWDDFGECIARAKSSYDICITEGSEVKDWSMKGSAR